MQVFPLGKRTISVIVVIVALVLSLIYVVLRTGPFAPGKPPLKPRDEVVQTKEIKVSTSDKDAGYMTREGKPQGFFYLDHRTVDSRHALITDTHVTPGNVHDSQPYLGRLDRQCERFGLTPLAVGLDAGYFTPMICNGLEQRGVYGVIGYRRPSHDTASSTNVSITTTPSAMAMSARKGSSCRTAPPTEWVTGSTDQTPISVETVR